MADANSTHSGSFIDDRLFFSLSSALAILANACHKRAPKAFREAAQVMDMTPSRLARNAALMQFILSDNKVIDDFGRDNCVAAQRAISEIVETVSVMMEIQNQADIDEIVRKESAQ